MPIEKDALTTRFFSRRNQVFLRGGLVVKRAADPESARAEAEILRALRRAGVPVPRVLERRESEIVMEYIRGETIPDFLARMELSPDAALLREAARALCRWFQCFYQAVDSPRSGENRGDVNGRNFIISPNGVVGVDFEERAFGSAERDIGRLLAFVRTYDPAQTAVKRQFSRDLKREAQERLGLSAPEICRQYRLERKAMGRRRGIAAGQNGGGAPDAL